MRRKWSRVIYCPMNGEDCARPTGSGKPLQIALETAIATMKEAAN